VAMLTVSSSLSSSSSSLTGAAAVGTVAGGDAS